MTTTTIQPEFKSKKVVLVNSLFQGSVKWDGDNDAYKRGIPLEQFPQIKIQSPQQPSSVGGGAAAGAGAPRPFSVDHLPIFMYCRMDKSTPRIWKPLVQGENLGDMTIIETGNLEDGGEVSIKKLLLNEAFLIEAGILIDHQFTIMAPPGAFLYWRVFYTGITLISSVFGPDGKKIGESTSSYSIIQSASRT